MANFPTNSDDVIFGDDANNSIDALLGNDVVFGGQGNDTLDGGGGDDMLNPGNGLDHLDGGFGNDTAFYSFDASGIYANLSSGEGWHLSEGAASDRDLYNSIENITATVHDDTIIGSDGANVLRGLGGQDVIKGIGGADRLEGGEGNDKLYGGAGADSILGGGGVDIIQGGAGADTIDGGSGHDHLSYADSTAGVTIKMKHFDTLGEGGFAQGDVIRNMDSLIGSDFADVLWGYDYGQGISGRDGNDDIRGLDENDTLDGGNGNDTLSGGSDNDTLYGHKGGDHLNGGTGIDASSYYNSTAAVVVDLATGIGSGGDAQGDTLTAIEDIVGSTHGDVLRGNADFNTLNGMSGNDILLGRGDGDALIGGAGRDTLNGGLGPDVYVFEKYTESGTTAATRDIVLTFQEGSDSFDLSAIDATPNLAGNGTFDFIGTDAFSGAHGELRYRHVNGKTFVDANMFGDTPADFSVRIDKVVNLTELDFYL